MQLKYKNIKDTIEELVQLQLNRGISPSELMDNIVTDNYIEISSKKVINEIHCKVKFSDEDFFDSMRTKYTYTYIYDNNLCLKEIKEAHDNVQNLIWSRELEEKKIMDKIMRMFDEYKLSKKVKLDFIESLPDNLYEIVYPYFENHKIV